MNETGQKLDKTRLKVDWIETTGTGLRLDWD